MNKCASGVFLLSFYSFYEGAVNFTYSIMVVQYNGILYMPVSFIINGKKKCFVLFNKLIQMLHPLCPTCLLTDMTRKS